MLLDDAERDQLLELLSRHAADGRIEFDELERRVERVAHARTREEADAVLTDLPPLPPPASAAPRTPRIGGRRGHGDADRPAPGWTATQERFRDPRSGAIMRVWVDSAGGRHYVPEA